MIDRELLERAGVSAKDAGELGQAWDAYQASNAKKTKKIPHIVCTGIYNAGKSTLLNALMGEDRFSTGDIPTTKVVAQAEFGGAVYIDTPGLNAEEEDDRETQNAYEAADFILFVSSAQNGGVSAAEARWLQKLRERYTADSLKQRLIFAVSHCGQVDEDSLPAVQAQFMGDLERALGFAPEGIFCVDSIIYQDGLEQNSSPLMEYSGIPRLKKALAEQIARAETLLQQARNAERDAILALVQILKGLCKKRMKEISNPAQRSEIDQMIEETRKAICDIKPSVHLDTYVYCSYGTTSFKRMGVTSPFTVEAEAKDALNCYGRECISEANDKLDKCMSEISSRCYHTGINSIYFDACDSVNKLLEELLLNLQKHGISVDSISEIQMEPDERALSRLPSKIDSIRSDLIFYDGKGLFNSYYDVFGNRFKSRDVKEGHFKKTLFGEKWVDDVGMEIDAYDAMSNTLRDVQKQMESFQKRASKAIDHVLQPLLEDLHTEADKRLKELRHSVQNSLIAAEQEATAPYQAALAYLDRLETEASK